MRGVRDQALLRLGRRVEPVEGGIEDARQAADLVVARLGEATRQVAGIRHCLGLSRECRDRPERTPGGEPAKRRPDHDPRARDNEQGDAEPAECLLHLINRACELDGHTLRHRGGDPAKRHAPHLGIPEVGRGSTFRDGAIATGDRQLHAAERGPSRASGTRPDVRRGRGDDLGVHLRTAEAVASPELPGRWKGARSLAHDAYGLLAK